jgi:hypothetical protein
MGWRALTTAAPDQAELRQNRGSGACVSSYWQKAQLQTRLAGEPNRYPSTLDPISVLSKLVPLPQLELLIFTQDSGGACRTRQTKLDAHLSNDNYNYPLTTIRNKS